MTWPRVSGAVPKVISFWPLSRSRCRFVWILRRPRFEETGQIDETSAIHISTHGLDFKIAADAKVSGIHSCREFAIYVRAFQVGKR